MGCGEGILFATIFSFALFLGCNDQPTVEEKRPILLDDPTPSEKPPNWAGAVHVLGSGSLPRSSPKIDRALMVDFEYSGTQLETIRRAVYRVIFRTPHIFRENKSKLSAAAGELFIDVSQHRLRARFVGPGWPVSGGAEIRLRADALGTYAFDRNGGQHLGPGKMATWFEGRQEGDSRSSVRVRKERMQGGQGPGELICALLAEWTAQERETVIRRCSSGSIPASFGFGPWQAELTALVPMEIERHQLRADEKQPPETVEKDDNQTFLAPVECARIAPYKRTLGADDGSTDGELRFINRTSTKVVVILEGIAVGWVDARSSYRFAGFRPGRYRIGAVRPFGTQIFAPKPVDLPGEITIGRPNESVAALHSENAPTD
ncbi:MAG: hypothetical protein JXA30_14100 [Deltaproteobacteria bacterium]|nr:hypothetical protein [Deltaproteobacteria bacterium]